MIVGILFGLVAALLQSFGYMALYAWSK